MLLRPLVLFLRTHPIAATIGGMAATVLGILQFDAYQQRATWPHQWQCHTRVRLGRLNHGRPEISCIESGQEGRPLAYLAGVWEHLQSDDSISKQLGETRLVVPRDSAAQRLTTQWNWNEATREFEFVGRTSSAP